MSYSKFFDSCSFSFLFSEAVALTDWWSGTECTLYADPKMYTLFGNENGIVVLNHSFEIDFLCSWSFCERFGVLGVRAGKKKVCQSENAANM